jgi:ATP-dependent Lon protease
MARIDGSHPKRSMRSCFPPADGHFRFHYPYVQAPSDVSHIKWLMTINSLDDLSDPLRARGKIIEFP